MKYKKLYGKEEFELIPYVKNYLENNENIEILIGCDSQNFAVKVRMYFIEDGKLIENSLVQLDY